MQGQAGKWLQNRLYSAALRRFRTPPCLWSKGISQYCDSKGPDSYWLSATESCQLEAFFLRYYIGAHGLFGFA